MKTDGKSQMKAESEQSSELTTDQEVVLHALDTILKLTRAFGIPEGEVLSRVIKGINANPKAATRH